MPQQVPSHPHLQYAQQSLSTAAAPQILPLTAGAPQISAMQTPQTPQLQTMQLQFPQTIQPYAANHQPVPQSATTSQIQLPVAQLPTPTASNTTTANVATEQKPPSNQTTKINIHNNNHSNHVSRTSSPANNASSNYNNNNNRQKVIPLSSKAWW
ncbi:15352_t:CDS:2 [Entrophospora sp. SA101]|nr:15352_t:CDS:2 [Entrophospora sp. SA101]